MLSTSAFNALLKTLEEPPEHVLFIFATTEPHKIPNTIISRCQRYDFKRIGESEIVAALHRIAQAEEIEVEKAALAHIAREANGGMRDSLSLLDQVIAFSGLQIKESDVRDVLGIAGRTVLKALVDAILSSDGQAALELIDAQHRRGLDLTKFTGELVRYVRDLLVIRVCSEPELLVDVPADELKSVQQWVSTLSAPLLHRTLNKLIAGADDIARSSFPKLVLEMTVLGMCHQGPTLPLADVLSGLERLEAKLSQSGISPADDVLASPQSSKQAPAVSAPEPTEPNDAQPAFESSRESVSPVDTVYRGDDQPSIPVTPAAVEQTAPTLNEPEHPLGKTVQPTPAHHHPSETRRPQSKMTPTTSSKMRQHHPQGMMVDNSATSTQISEAPEPPPSPPQSAPEPAQNPQVETSSGSAHGEGFKKRPNDGLYDDFSAGPPQPRPLDKLRPLAVKPRISAAIAREDVEKFLAPSTKKTPNVTPSTTAAERPPKNCRE